MRPKLHRCAAILLLLAAAIASSTSAHAQPSAADKNTARALLLEGRAKLKDGDAQAALKWFHAAHTIMGVPTTGLAVAKAQVALGLLLEARNTAVAVTRLPVAPKEPSAFADARAEAAQLVEELTGRISSLAIHVRGPPAGVAVSVRVDGTEIPAATLPLPPKASPYGTEPLAVTPKEGETAPMDLMLTPPASPPPPARTAKPAGSSAPDGAAPAGEGAGRHVPGWAWGAGVAGLAALGVGVGFAVDYASVRSAVATDCPGNVCDRKRYDKAGVDALHARWNRDIGLATGLGAAGLIGVGTAVVGIMAAKAKGAREPRRHAHPGEVVVLWLSPSAAGAGIQGVF